nr:MOSC domain-containing protein [Bradyrhizobium sp. WSM2254]
MDDKHRFGKPPRVSATLIAGLGVEGDAHFGTFVKHRYLARRNPRSPNLRQVHLLPSELFAELRTDGYDLGPGDLGENITTAGLDLESLPLDTELKIGSTATVRVTGLRTPCVLIDRFKNGLKGHLVCNLSGPPFRAGVMGVVSHGGEVCPGDAIQVDLPTRPRRLLPPL